MEDRELNPKTDCFHPKSGEDHVQHWVADWLRTAVARNIEEINKSFSHTPMAQNLVEFEKDVFDARAFFAAKKIDDTIVRGDQSQTKSAIDSAFFSSPEPWQRLETACRVNDFLNDRKSHGLTTPGFRAMVGQTVDGLDLRSMQVDTPLYDRPENVISEKPQKRARCNHARMCSARN